MDNDEVLKALCESHFDRDDDRFCSVVLGVAATHARSGSTKVARELRGLADKIKERPPPPGVTHDTEGTLEVEVIHPARPREGLKEVVLSAENRERLGRVIDEQRRNDTLASHGLRPRNRLFLAGPTGSGKTHVARHLAAELNLPLMAVRGCPGTASLRTLRGLLDQLHRRRGLYLFEEGCGVGPVEYLLDRETSRSLLVVTSSTVPANTDGLWRYDEVLAFGDPSGELFEQLLRNHLSAFDLTGVQWSTVRAWTVGMSLASAARAADDLLRLFVSGTKALVTDDIREAVRVRAHPL